VPLAGERAATPYATIPQGVTRASDRRSAQGASYILVAEALKAYTDVGVGEKAKGGGVAPAAQSTASADSDSRQFVGGAPGVRASER